MSSLVAPQCVVVGWLVDRPVSPRHERAVEKHLSLVRGGGSDLSWLARDHEEALRAFARRLCRNRSDADDLVQDTLARAMTSLATLKPATNARSWLMSILHNLFIDSCRKQSSRGQGVALDEVAHELPAGEPDPEPAWATLGHDDVNAALRQLDVGFREVYRLHAQGQSYEQIAKALEIPKATVGTRLLRARKKLKALLFP